MTDSSSTPGPATGPGLTLTFGDTTITVELADTEATRDLVSRLPLTLSFSDYAGQEKLAHLDEALAGTSMSERHSPEPGDLTFYVPDGVLVLSYRNVGSFPGICYLGHTDADLSAVRTMAEGSEVTLSV